MLSGYPENLKYACNKNMLFIGGSGSGKIQFFLKPNLFQMRFSYVITDPKEGVLLECVKVLEKNLLSIKISVTISK